jgi:hypothetical protein
MGWVLLTIAGAGAARAAWVLAKAYGRMADIRDELDDSLHEHAMEQPETAAKGR